MPTFSFNAYSVALANFDAAVQLGFPFVLDAQVAVEIDDDDGVVSSTDFAGTSVRIGDDEQGPITSITYRSIAATIGGVDTMIDVAVIERSNVADYLIVPIDRDNARVIANLEVQSEPFTVGEEFDLPDGLALTADVVDPNTPPVANDDDVETDEDNSVLIDLGALVSDADGDPLTVTPDDPANGMLEDLGDNIFRYTPDADYNGSDGFSYEVSDGEDSATGDISIVVNSVNDAPEVSPLGPFNVGEDDAPQVYNLLAGVTDVDGDDLSILNLQANWSGGSLTLVPTVGGFTFDPGQLGDELNDGDTGVVTVNFQVSDGTTTVGNVAVINVAGADESPTNEAPVAMNDDEETLEDNAVAIDILGNDEDPDGDELDVELGTPSNGMVEFIDGVYLYTPDENFNGEDSFTYTISDGEFESTATVNIFVEAVNDAPEAEDGEAETDEDNSVIIDLAALVSDVDGDDLEITPGDPANGSLTDNGDGTYTYAPDADYNGSDSFTYEVSDGEETASGSVAIVINPINDDPVAEDDSESTAHNTAVNIDVLNNDSDVDNDDLTIVSVAGAVGAVVIAADGKSLEYTPVDGFSGNDTFSYTIDDGNGGTATADVTVAVAGPTNSPPVADDDDATTDEDTPVAINILGNDEDPDGDDLTVELGTPSNGSVELIDGEYVYTPDENFNGEDSFTYTVSDGEFEDEATVNIFVEALNDEPEAEDDEVETDEDNSVVIDLGALVSDVDGDELTITPDDPSNGELTDNGDGTYTYTPDADFNGSDGFSYLVDDGDATATGNISITVNPVNDAPVAGAVGPLNVSEDDAPVSVDVLSAASDVDGDVLSVSGVSASWSGGALAVTQTSDGFTFDPDQLGAQLDAGENAAVTVSYQIADGTTSTGGSVLINVAGADDDPAPVVVEGTNGNDLLMGTTADEIILSNGGIYDRVFGGGGSDHFVFGEEIGNDVAERDVIYDFDTADDTICLSTEEYSVAVFGTTGVISAGEDLIYVRGTGITQDDLENSIEVGCVFNVV